MLAQIVPPNIQVNLPANMPNVPPEWVPWLGVALGVIVLLFGRALYWAFVAIVGFFIGMELAANWSWLNQQEHWVQLLVAIGCGIVGAILGIFVQRLAFAIGGFFAGGYLALAIAGRMHVGGDPNIWMIVGGVIGAIAAALIMDWAIIVLSSLAGAAAIISPFQQKIGDDRITAVLFFVIAAVGIIFQGRHFMVTRVPPPTAAPPPVV
jgi:hypothetical protein